jgi:hypothetical protein
MKLYRGQHLYDDTRHLLPSLYRDKTFLDDIKYRNLVFESNSRIIGKEKAYYNYNILYAFLYKNLKKLQEHMSLIEVFGLHGLNSERLNSCLNDNDLDCLSMTILSDLFMNPIQDKNIYRALKESFMKFSCFCQHWGWKSPFIDFTESLEQAEKFGTHKWDKEKNDLEPVKSFDDWYLFELDYDKYNKMRLDTYQTLDPDLLCKNDNIDILSLSYKDKTSLNLPLASTSNIFKQKGFLVFIDPIFLSNETDKFKNDEFYRKVIPFDKCITNPLKIYQMPSKTLIYQNEIDISFIEGSMIIKRIK